jgi:ACS family hexuronate transporter-like MFS transporter
MVDMIRGTSTIDETTESRATVRAWCICGLMLLATMLNYMDRQALAQQATDITRDLRLTNEDYGSLERGFGLAFAVGGLVTGFFVDRIGPRWIYPAVLLGWSAVGFATGWVTSFRELFYCRVLLGLFESGQWPCALATAQRLLSRRDRPLGNSIIQSGAALGAIATPIVVLSLTTSSAESWRLPFRVIGAAGAVWIAAWILLVRPNDLRLGDDQVDVADSSAKGAGGSDRATFFRRFLALVVVATTITLCFQYFRAWMPKMLREQHHYTAAQVQYFSVAYYLATDAGCMAVGFLVRWLTARGFTVHAARFATFFACVLLTSLSTVAAILPASWMLLLTLQAIGFGSLGQHPIYYALTQELSKRRMGNVIGILSFITWVVNSLVQDPIGRWIDRTGSFSQVTFVAGLMPILGLVALGLMWNAGMWRGREHSQTES